MLTTGFPEKKKKESVYQFLWRNYSPSQLPLGAGVGTIRGPGGGAEFSRGYRRIGTGEAGEGQG